MPPALTHVRAWIFDMDNTLYPASANLFAPIAARMTDYIVRLLDLPAAEAAAVRRGYFHSDGTTLAA